MNDLPLPIVDLAVFAILLISALFATLRGFTHEVLAVSSWAAAILAVIFGLPYLRPLAREHINVNWIADASAAAVIFLVTLIIAAYLTRSASHGVRDSALSPVDRALGFIFGAFRGGLIIVLAYIGMAWVLDISAPPKWMQEAKTTPWIVTAADKVKEITPNDLFITNIQTPAENSKRAAKDAIALERTLRTWSAPTPKAPEETKTEPNGYAEDQRRDMNRLIDANR